MDRAAAAGRAGENAVTLPYAMNAIGVPSRPRAMRSLGDVRRRAAQLYFRLAHHVAHRRYVAAVNAWAERGFMVGGWFQQHKYLGEYFALSFTRAQRRDLVLAHYRHVERQASEAVLRQVGGDGIVVWEHAFDDHVTAIRLRTSQFAPVEGEWQLQYLCDGVGIGTLTFLFGAPAGFAAFGEVVCLIGGVQGGRDAREAIRVAAKGNDEIAASSMLVLATRALARAFGVEHVFGIASREQVFTLHSGERMKADYDALWLAEGASRVVDGFHPLSVDRVERELSDIPRSHRRRTRRKRERKAEIEAAILARVQAVLAGARYDVPETPAPSGLPTAK